jgi:hypothetical protein
MLLVVILTGSIRQSYRLSGKNPTDDLAASNGCGKVAESSCCHTVGACTLLRPSQEGSCARVAKWQTQRTQNPPPQGVPVQVRPRARVSLCGGKAALPDNTRLGINECFRPRSVQATYWERTLARMRHQYPDWNDQQVAAEAAKFVAPPWITPPHCTGGAVDLVLIDDKGDHVGHGERAGRTLETDTGPLSPRPHVRSMVPSNSAGHDAANPSCAARR